jgi:hypothetical protein
VLDVLGDFDELGGASLGLLAWELGVAEQRVAGAWEQAQAEGLIEPAGWELTYDEQLWRLTSLGWTARRPQDTNC